MELFPGIRLHRQPFNVPFSAMHVARRTRSEGDVSMRSDDEDFPVSYLLYVVVVLAAIAAISIGGFIFWLR
jgi:hypothetical protein